jgi:hypothetical protein
MVLHPADSSPMRLEDLTSASMNLASLLQYHNLDRISGVT